MEKFSNAFDVLECKHNLRQPCKEGPLFCYSESWPLIVAARTKEGGEKKGNIFLKKRTAESGKGSPKGDYSEISISQVSFEFLQDFFKKLGI